MKYLELTVTTTSQAEELVADIFWRYTDYGVAISSVKDVIELTEAKVKSYDYLEEGLLRGDASTSLVKGFFPLEDAERLCGLVASDIAGLRKNAEGVIETGTLEAVKRTVDGDDWIEVWRKHFRPISFGKITVCPEWISYEGEGEVVYLDSNMAFGTGEHETTAMCLSFLEKYVTADCSVMDVGTGSGILGISAAKLGAKKVVMTDVDKIAVEAANRNAKRNGVGEACRATLTNLLDGVTGSADIVVANITAEILVVLACDVKTYVKKNGVVILSGILNDRVDLVLDAYLSVGLKREEVITRGEWTAVVLRA